MTRDTWIVLLGVLLRGNWRWSCQPMGDLGWKTCSKGMAEVSLYNYGFVKCWAPRSSCLTLFSTIFGLDFHVRYSSFSHLPPLIFHSVRGCWDRTQDCCNACLRVRRCNHSSSYAPTVRAQIYSVTENVSSKILNILEFLYPNTVSLSDVSLPNFVCPTTFGVPDFLSPDLSYPGPFEAGPFVARPLGAGYFVGLPLKDH
jgi:hypothetical protein